MTNLILGGIILVILALAIAYIVKAKKNGAKCIGCPASGACSSHCSGCTSSNLENEIQDCQSDHCSCK